MSTDRNPLLCKQAAPLIYPTPLSFSLSYSLSFLFSFFFSLLCVCAFAIFHWERVQRPWPPHVLAACSMNLPFSLKSYNNKQEGKITHKRNNNNKQQQQPKGQEGKGKETHPRVLLVLLRLERQKNERVPFSEDHT